jgi:hypothetical protein
MLIRNSRKLAAARALLEELAYLKFLTSLIHGTLGGFVRSQQQDRSEFCRLADNIHLNLKQMFLFVERRIGTAHEAFCHVAAVFYARI